MVKEESLRPVRCSFSREGSWRPCVVLKKAVDGKHLVAKLLVNFSTGRTWEIPVLHSGEFLKKGIVLNHCPFCGVSLKRLYSSSRKG